MWIRKCLQNRTLIVQVGGKRSGENRKGCGIPQGTVLGTIMFIFFLKSTTASISNNIVTMYADYLSIKITNKSALTVEIDTTSSIPN